jgi:hypothetical protein
MSAGEPLSPTERRCVTTQLIGSDAGGAPVNGAVVELRLRLRPDGTNDVRSVISK